MLPFLQQLGSHQMFGKGSAGGPCQFGCHRPRRIQAGLGRRDEGKQIRRKKGRLAVAASHLHLYLYLIFRLAYYVAEIGQAG